MITHHIDNQNKIIEITISGSISREDLAAAFKGFAAPLQEWDDIRILKRVDSFTGIEPMALFDDLKFGYENLANYKKISKIAIVTDKEWISKLAGITKNLAPGEVQVFENEDIEEARSWLR